MDDSTTSTQDEQNAAANVIREKVAKLYADEPVAQQELAEAEAGGELSKHQRFMLELAHSGRSLAEIQTAWHNYYLQLPDVEKHAVWQEFYQKSRLSTAKPRAHLRPAQQGTKPHVQISEPQFRAPEAEQPPAPEKTPTVAEMKKRIRNKVSAQGRLTAKHHAKTLAVMFISGFFGVGVVMFGFFNERFIAPFIQPSRLSDATPIIIDPNATQANVGPESKVIIPKINVEAPVVYDNTNTEEKAFQTALESGTVHYAGTALPGQQGNAVIFGHSSNNLLNRGKYKFVFVSLNKLEIDDTFVLQHAGVRYVYKVFNKKIVQPTEVGVLTELPRPNMATLITCDPPGTADKRLVVQAEQITPDPAGNIAAETTELTQPEIVPGNAPSLFSRLIDFLFGD